MVRATALAAALMVSGAAHAAIEARFVESAPKDRFEFTNAGACALADVEVVVDVSGAAGGVYFDTTASGAGVEVFQPLRMEKGAVTLASAPVRDGDTAFTVRIGALEAGEQAVVSVDVDDRQASGALGQIRVAGSEMAGATIRVTVDGKTASAALGGDNRARIAAGDC